MSIRDSQRKMLDSLVAEYKAGNYTPEAIDANNTFYLCNGEVSDYDLDNWVAHSLTPEQSLKAINFCIRNHGYAKLLDEVLFHLGFDADDRGEAGQAPHNVYHM